MELNLKDRVAFITGANRGIGLEFARQYAEQGRSLVLVARRLDRLQALAEALRRQYRIDVVVEQVDLSDIAAVIDLHRRLQERGIAIDILINNAGHGLQGPFVDSQLDAALAMVQLDVASVTAVTHVFAQDMRARGRGKILLVASLLAFQGVQNFAVYSAAKAYVLRLGEALHRELKRDGVTVTALCPGMSDTGFATAAQQKITPALKRMMMQPAPRSFAAVRQIGDLIVKSKRSCARPYAPLQSSCLARSVGLRGDRPATTPSGRSSDASIWRGTRRRSGA
jgi:short-subunit dehydrogenase